ncbi:MAG: hypothetical protein PHX43_08060 [Alphaproteobacteria bacterium]|nr:hypothetical protein [Alphaproteobacteria bacterium]
MNARIYSLYWDNIDPRIVAGQKEVFDRFGLAVNQHRINGFDHGEWIDWIMTRMDDVDVFFFIDTDCIPLSKEKVMERITQAAGGMLVGAEGAANHIDPNRSYVGAWYAFINRKVWSALQRPSAKPTANADVCQLWTDTWRYHNLPVTLIPPTSFVKPKWDLPGRPQCYGIGTTYGDDCFHLFEARGAGNQEIFISRCNELLSQ